MPACRDLIKTGIIRNPDALVLTVASL